LFLRYLPLVPMSETTKLIGELRAKRRMT
jgi:hypothetical protein